MPNKSKPLLPETMVQIFEGVNLTQRVTIAMGFFLYSASVFEVYYRIASASRSLGVNADYYSILMTDTNESADLMMSNIVMEVCARLLYEGSGSLGGYKERVWLLWGRLRNIPCPTNPGILSEEEALECYAFYQDAEEGVKCALFITWFQEAYQDEFHNKGLVQEIARRVWILYERYQTYTRYENGILSFADMATAAQQGKVWWWDDMGAILSGNFRRLSKGVLHSPASDWNNINPLCTVLDLKVNDIFLTDLYLNKGFVDADGNLTPFAIWLSNSMSLALNRVEIKEDLELETLAAS